MRVLFTFVVDEAARATRTTRATRPAAETVGAGTPVEMQSNDEDLVRAIAARQGLWCNWFDAGCHVDTNSGAGGFETTRVRREKYVRKGYPAHGQVFKGTRLAYCGGTVLPAFGLVINPGVGPFMHADFGGRGGRLIRRVHATVAFPLRLRALGWHVRELLPMWIDW